MKSVDQIPHYLCMLCHGGEMTTPYSAYVSIVGLRFRMKRNTAAVSSSRNNRPEIQISSHHSQSLFLSGHVAPSVTNVAADATVANRVSVRCNGRMLSLFFPLRAGLSELISVPVARRKAHADVGAGGRRLDD